MTARFGNCKTVFTFFPVLQLFLICIRFVYDAPNIVASTMKNIRCNCAAACASLFLYQNKNKLKI
jgi:hypothetical protein